MSSTTEQIKERIGIVELIGSYLKLEKAGSNFKANCPFHNEKTPSFVVSPDRESYYCFGCGAKGDVFSFVQDFESVDFVGALKILADKTGVEIRNENPELKTKKDRQIKILEAATIFFEKSLDRNKKANDYLESRSLEKETIEKWRIGYAPSDWESLLSIFRLKKIPDTEIEKVGLIKKNEKGKYYDRFRNRIIFPIFDAGGLVLGFTGRILEDDGKSAKYLNSPETELFQKSKILYGYNFAKTSIRKNDFSILVEGQMDAIMAHQAGYQNTVATSGTAMGEYQLELLKRASSKLVIALDGDGAGFKASQRVWRIALSIGMDVKIADMPTGKDPADIISEDVDEWKQIIKNSKHIIDFLIERLKKEDLENREIARKIHQDITPYVAELESAVERSHFVDSIHRKFNISRDALWTEVENYKNNNERKDDTKKVFIENENTKKPLYDVSKTLSGIIAWQESKKNKDINIEETKEKIKESLGDSWVEFEEQIKKINTDSPELIFDIERRYDNKIILIKETEELMNRLVLKNKETKLILLNQELAVQEEKGDEEKTAQLLKEINKLSIEINNLKQK